MSNNGWSNQDVNRVVIVETGAYTGLFFYAPAPGHGNLLASWTAAAGVDPYNNHYPAGLTTFYADERVALLIGYAALGGQSLSLLADSASATPGQIVLGTSGGGGLAAFIQAVSDGGGIISDFTLNAVAPGGWYSSAIASINPNDASIAETWHSAAGILTGNWSSALAGNPVRYRLEPHGSGQAVRLDGQVDTFGAGPWPAGTLIFQLPVGYQPTMFHSFTTPSAIDVTANEATLQVFAGGAVKTGQAFTAANQALFFDGVTFPLD